MKFETIFNGNLTKIVFRHFDGYSENGDRLTSKEGCQIIDDLVRHYEDLNFHHRIDFKAPDYEGFLALILANGGQTVGEIFEEFKLRKGIFMGALRSFRRPQDSPVSLETMEIHLTYLIWKYVDGLYGCGRDMVAMQNPQRTYGEFGPNEIHPNAVAMPQWHNVTHFRNPMVHPWGGTWSYN